MKQSSYTTRIIWQDKGQVCYTLETSERKVLTLLVANTHSIEQGNVFMRDLTHHACCLKESLRRGRKRNKSNHTDDRILGSKIAEKIRFKSPHGSLQLKMAAISSHLFSRHVFLSKATYK